MENEIVIYSDNSSDSVKEVEPPKKPPPVVINVEDDELILNVNENTTQYLAEHFFRKEEIPRESPGDNPNHWTEDMKKFYNEDWGDELNFSIERIQEKMDKQPYLWQVSQRDLLAKNKKRKSYMKCWNCCQYGHNVYKCKEPLHIPKCHMCGVAGHIETGCPNSICLNCGNQMGSYVTHCGKCSNETYIQCTRCSLFGHHFINCSDNWRRFHSTIGKVEIDVPTQVIYKEASDLWCCNCGKKGHCQLHCSGKKQLAFPETFPFIASYENSFNVQTVNHTVSVPQLIYPTQKKTRQRRNNHRQRNNVKNLFNVVKSLNKLHEVKKPKKKRKKKNKDRNRNKLFQTPDFIPL